MNKQSKHLVDIFTRYFLIIFFGLGGLFIFYKIFTPLTIFTYKTILSIFGNVDAYGSIILFGTKYIEIIPACVAGAAYYLLFILAMSIEIDIKKRLKIIGLSFGLFFVFNIFRLLILTSFIDFNFFEIMHWISWHIISSIFIFGIWVYISRKFKLKEIPIYSDFKFILGLSKKKTQRKKKNK